MRAILALLAMILAIVSASVGRAETLMPSGRNWSEKGGWKIYWNAENEGCFAERRQADGTVMLIGMLGKDNRLALGFRSSKLGFAKNGKAHELTLLIEDRWAFSVRMKSYDLGGGAFMLAVYDDAAKIRPVIEAAEKLTFQRHNKGLAAISLKGSNGAFKAIDACRAAIQQGTIEPVGVGSDDRSTLAEAYKLESDALSLYDAANYVGAEQLYRRVLEIREKVLGPEHPNIADSLNGLANVLRYKGDLAGAEQLYSRVLAIRVKALGPEHPDVAKSTSNLALVLWDKGDLVAAEPLYRRALEIFEKALGPKHPDVANNLNSLALLLWKKGDLAGAEPLYRRALAIDEKTHGSEHPDVATDLNNLALLFWTKGDVVGAEPLFRRALAINEKALGPDHASVARILNTLAGFLSFKGDPAGSLALARRAAQAGYPDRSSYLHALFASAKNRTATIGESVQAVQQAMSSQAGAALHSVALRASSGGGTLAEVIRSEQDLAGELTKLESAILAEVSKEPELRSKPKEDAIRARTGVVTAELAKIREKLARGFPRYAELSRPSALSLEETQQLLLGDEALIVIDIAGKGEGDDYLWVVTRDEAEWRLIEIRQGEIADDIARLRAGLDPSDSSRRPIDPALAHELYAKLFDPVEPAFASEALPKTDFGRFTSNSVESVIAGKKHLIFVLNGAISSLPPQVLVSKPPVDKEFRNAAWLIRDYAITVLPTVSSLKLLRSGANIEKAAKPFIGFGDPVWNPEELCGEEKRVTALDGRGLVRDGVTDIAALRGAPRLCGTGPELQAVAKSLGAAEKDVVLREGASEAAVKRAALSDYNIVYFATHGLVAGEMEAFNKEKAEPALALSAPETATDDDDGLLTASEVAQLKLNADWVVLSACNTAAEGKPGAPALSGLARAFFYAGARSLLVSHWYVDDEATAALMSRTFAAAAAHPERRQAEALREAMLSVMNDPKHKEWADPGYWAPFVLVGEARR